MKGYIYVGGQVTIDEKILSVGYPSDVNRDLFGRRSNIPSLSVERPIGSSADVRQQSSTFGNDVFRTSVVPQCVMWDGGLLFVTNTNKNTINEEGKIDRKRIPCETTNHIKEKLESKRKKKLLV